MKIEVSEYLLVETFKVFDQTYKDRLEQAFNLLQELETYESSDVGKGYKFYSWGYKDEQFFVVGVNWDYLESTEYLPYMRYSIRAYDLLTNWGEWHRTMTERLQESRKKADKYKEIKEKREVEEKRFQYLELKKYFEPGLPSQEQYERMREKAQEAYFKDKHGCSLGVYTG